METISFGGVGKTAKHLITKQTASHFIGQTGTYTGSNYNDKIPISRQGLAVVKKIGQRVEKVIQKVIQIAKHLINKDDCELENKQDVVALWEKKNKQILDMAQETLPNIQENNESLNIDTLTELLNYLKANKNTTDPIDNDVKPDE